MNKYTFLDSIEEDIIGVETNNLDNLQWFNIIKESQGIVDEYYSIAFEAYDALCEVNPNTQNTRYSESEYIINCYEFKQKCFIKSAKLIVFGGNKHEMYRNSMFYGDFDEISLSNDKRLINVIFRISIDDIDIKTSESRKKFMQSMAHEIQHAYRFYKICLSNNNTIDNERKRKRMYNNYASNILHNNGENNDVFFAAKLYATEKDEISSMSNELFEYVKEHDYINPNNYKNFLNEMPLYWVVNMCLRELDDIDELIFSNDIDEILNVGNSLIRLMNLTDVTPQKAVLKYRFRLISMGNYARRIFFRTLNYAFNTFERVSKQDVDSSYIREMIERQYNEKTLQKLLESFE